VPAHAGTASGSFTFAISVATGEVEHSALTRGWFTFTGTAVGEGIDPTYRFEPPTYRVVSDPPLLTKARRIPMQQSFSVVRINGSFVQVKSPSSEQLEAAGVEGEDYFIGGHVYTAIPQAVGLELQAAGYNATEN
jgi:hypothetical protein